jgi:hypothetical protein
MQKPKYAQQIFSMKKNYDMLLILKETCQP